jgi:hypothetical protein
MSKHQRWGLTLNQEIESEITHIENQFKSVYGNYPSKTDILKILVSSFKGKKITRKKRRTPICV